MCKLMCIYKVHIFQLLHWINGNSGLVGGHGFRTVKSTLRYISFWGMTSNCSRASDICFFVGLPARFFVILG